MPRNGNPEYSNLIAPFGSISYDMSFDSLYKHYFNQLSYIAMRLLIFDGIPETIDETFLKYCILILGRVCFFRLDQEILDNRQSDLYRLKPGDLVALNCSKAQIQTIYYINRDVLITNPVFTKTYQLQPGKDCVVVYCTEPDKYQLFGRGGLFKLIARTATILADNDISINVLQKNTRLTNIVGADDQQTKISADAAIKAMYDGEPYVVVQKSLVSELQSVPMTAKTSDKDIVQLIEARQYIYSHFYEALGLQTHDNMKKERLITEEINDNEELSALNIDDIIVTIRDGLDQVNNMFGTNITVSLNPIVKKAHNDGNNTIIGDRGNTEAELAGSQPALDPEQDDQTEDQTEDQPDDYSGTAAELLDDLADVLEDAAELLGAGGGTDV